MVSSPTHIEIITECRIDLVANSNDHVWTIRNSCRISIPKQLQLQVRTVNTSIHLRWNSLEIHVAQIWSSISWYIIAYLVPITNFVLLTPCALGKGVIRGEKTNTYELPSLPVLAICTASRSGESETERIGSWWRGLSLVVTVHGVDLKSRRPSRRYIKITNSASIGPCIRWGWSLQNESVVIISRGQGHEHDTYI